MHPVSCSSPGLVSANKPSRHHGVVGHLASSHGCFFAVVLHIGDAPLLSPKRTVGDLDELLTSHDQGG